MKQYETLLAVVPAKAELTPGIKRAVELARASGAALHLCMFEYDSAVDLAAERAGPDVAGHVRNDIVLEREEKLQRLAAGLAGKGSVIECDVVWAPDQAEAVLAKTLQINAQVVVKDAHHESTLRRAVRTPLDWKLMRLLPCELMLVGPGPHPKPKRVAAAIDVLAEPTDADGLNKRILEAALLLSEYLDARLDLLSVFPFYPTIEHRAWPSSKAIYAEANAAHYEAFMGFAEAHSIPQDRRQRLAGMPSFELSKFTANNHVDLLVVGSLYRARWDRFLLGSTTESLAQEIDSDLMLVKPHGFLDMLSSKIDLSALRERYN